MPIHYRLPIQIASMHPRTNRFGNGEADRASGESQKPGLLFSIVAFFAGAWYFLDQRIVQLTSSSSGAVAVPALVVANFLCFTYPGPASSPASRA